MRTTLRWVSITCLSLAALRGQAQPPDYTNTTPQEPAIAWKQVPSDILHAQKKIWLFPTEVVRGRHVGPTLLAIGSTAGMVALDPTVARYFRDNEADYHGLNRRLSGTATTAGVLAVPAAFYITGLVTKDTYLKNTAMLAAEAALDVEIPNLVLRNTIRRLRPIDVPPGGSYSDTWFKTSGNPFSAHGSFPSGHSAAAFAVATVIAKRYSKHRWVPFVAYGTAALVGFSRVSSNTHFLSDVAFGGVLGFSVGNMVAQRR